MLVSVSQSHALCSHCFLACFFRCGRAGCSLLCLGHIVSIVGLPPVLLRHCLVFRDLLNFVVRAGCFLRCDFLRRIVRAFGFCNILISVSLFKIVVTFAVNCQRPDLFQSLIKNWSNGRSSCCHRRLLLLVHTPHVERHSCSAQQLLFSLYHRPVSCLSRAALARTSVVCRFAPKTNVSLLSLLFKLAELGLRVRLASVASESLRLKTRAWQSSVRVVEHCAAKPDGFLLFTSPACAVPSPPQTVGSDDWCKLARSCSTGVPFHDCHVCATSHRGHCSRRHHDLALSLVTSSSRGMG